MSTVPAFAVPAGRGARPGRRDRARLNLVPRRRVRAARMPFVTLVSLVLVGGVVGLLCFNTQMQKASFAETDLRTRAGALSAREQTLHDQVQALRDPQHLAQAAQNAGMVIPETACTLTIGTGVTRDDCTPATNADTPSLTARPPQKPAVIDPAPQVTTVQAAPQDVAPTTTTTATTTGHHRHRAHRVNHRADTGRG